VSETVHACARARVQVLDLSNEIHNLNILERAIMLGGESWLDGGVVVENIGAALRAHATRPDLGCLHRC
jgi:hypothetical protein